MEASASIGRQGTPVAVGLGSNRSHGRFGAPRAVLLAAVKALEDGGLVVDRLSPIIETPPLGPSRRRYANAALKGCWGGSAESLLALLKGLERAFGRRGGQRWGARVLDCDLLAFGGATLRQSALQVPHPRLHERDFVLRPLATVWPDWRHPERNLSVRQMRARLNKPRAVD